MRTIFCLLLAFLITSGAEATTYLRDNLKRAKKGDFIVTNQSKAYTLLHIYDKTANTLTIEEVTVPTQRMPKGKYAWRDWITEGAPNHTSWVMYEINLNTGEMQEYFSFTNNGWHSVPRANNFLSTLLNLRLSPVPPQALKRIGPKPKAGMTDQRRIWQPVMVVDGQTINNVTFQALRTRWPRDGGELSGRTIEVYVPKEDQLYPSYFPYWLQISGMLGQAKVRIIDSGGNLVSPKSPLPRQQDPISSTSY